MLFSRRYRKADKDVGNARHFIVDSDGDALINVKAANREQIFSTYNYEKNHKLNKELDEFIYDKARFVPPNKEIRIKVYTEENANKEEIEEAIINNYKKDALEIKTDMKINLFFSVAMLLVGIAFFALLLLMHTFFYNDYLSIVLEIIVWVFIWEAVDSFFLRRHRLKRKQRILLNLCMAKIEVVDVVE